MSLIERFYKEGKRKRTQFAPRPSSDLFTSPISPVPRKGIVKKAAERVKESMHGAVRGICPGISGRRDRNRDYKYKTYQQHLFKHRLSLLVSL